MIEEQNVDLHKDCRTRIDNLKRIRANLHEALRAHLPDYELHHVEKQLESDRAQNLAAQKEIRDLKLQLQRALSGNSKTKCETDPSDKMAKLIDEQDSLAAAEKAEMTKQFDQLKKECETANQDLIVTKDALIAAEQSAKDKINEFDTKVAELADAKENFAAVEREKGNLLNELQSKEAALSSAMIAEDESENTVKQLQQELDSTTEERNSAQRALLAATGAKDNAEKSAKQMCTDLKAEKELSINKIRAEMAKEKEEMTKQFDQLKKECETANQDLIVAKDALIAAEQSAKDKINEFDTKVAELADAKENFAAVEREKGNLLNELQSKEAALSSAMTAEDESEDTVKQLQQELDSTTEERNSAQRALLAAMGAKDNAEKTAKQMCTDLKAEKELSINKIRAEMAKEKEEMIKQFDTVAAKLADENMKISKDLENATGAKQDSEQELQQELSAIKDEMRLADAERDAAKKELISATNAKTEAEEKAEELREELENLKDEYAANATIRATIREPSEAEPTGLLQQIIRDNECRSLSQDNNDSGFYSSTYGSRDVSDSDESENLVRQARIIWTTNTGSLYHSSDCSYLRVSRIPVVYKESMASRRGCIRCSGDLDDVMWHFGEDRIVRYV